MTAAAEPTGSLTALTTAECTTRTATQRQRVQVDDQVTNRVDTSRKPFVSSFDRGDFHHFVLDDVGQFEIRQHDLQSTLQRHPSQNQIHRLIHQQTGFFDGNGIQNDRNLVLTLEVFDRVNQRGIREVDRCLIVQSRCNAPLGRRRFVQVD